MDGFIKELNIDKNRITGVSHKSAAWNAKMMATTALLCVLSITPYIYINLGVLKERLYMGIPNSAFYWRFHHSRTYSTAHSTTDNDYFR